MWALDAKINFSYPNLKTSVSDPDLSEQIWLQRHARTNNLGEYMNHSLPSQSSPQRQWIKYSWHRVLTFNKWLYVDTLHPSGENTNHIGKASLCCYIQHLSNFFPLLSFTQDWCNAQDKICYLLLCQVMI